MIVENIKRIMAHVPENVTLMAATKTRTVEEIRIAVDAGIKVIGENYVQEAYSKYFSLNRNVEWHLIGHLQKNKVKKACEIFDVIETVDSVRLAEAIDRRCQILSKKIQVFIEVNSGREPQKVGVMPEDVFSLAEALQVFSNIHLTGVMTMGPAVSEKEIRPYFRETASIFRELQKEYPDIKYLSMGMSDSWRVAIEEGANIIRLGTAIFGPRESKK